MSNIFGNQRNLNRLEIQLLIGLITKTPIAVFLATDVIIGTQAHRELHCGGRGGNDAET